MSRPASNKTEIELQYDEKLAEQQAAEVELANAKKGPAQKAAQQKYDDLVKLVDELRT